MPQVHAAAANHSRREMNLEEFTKALRRAKYIQSTQAQNSLPIDLGQEWAFMGRSNAGKSSLLNSITGIKIAKTSKTPGRTKCMNIFEISHHTRIVDFPGYGFAKVSKQEIQKWEYMIDNYLQTRNCLAGICIVIDIRHIGLKSDLEFLNLACSYEIPIRIVLNKADKLSKNKIAQAIMTAKKMLSVFKHPNITVQQYSTTHHIGKSELISWLHACPINTPM